MSAGPANSPHPHASTRDRLLESAKHLFATRGFENASTVAIARAAQTSESQLVKHFGSKEGLLEAIFEQAWDKLAAHLRNVQSLPTPAEKLRSMLEIVTAAFDRDPEVKELLLLEGRRIRKEGGLFMLTAGFMNFVRTIDSILGDMKAAGQLRADITVEAARSALMGMFEGMMRDQVLAARAGYPAAFTSEDTRRLFGIVVEAISRKT